MTTRRDFAIGAGVAAGLVAAPTIARAQTQKWRMVTSWPKRLPGPGMSAERVAERIRALSAGKLDIAVYAAGEVVPAFEVLDAVGNSEDPHLMYLVAQTQQKLRKADETKKVYEKLS